jgi:hypothetical protein
VPQPARPDADPGEHQTVAAVQKEDVAMRALLMFLLVASAAGCGANKNAAKAGGPAKPGPDGVIEITDSGHAPDLQANIGQYRGKKVRLSGMLTSSVLGQPESVDLRTTNGQEVIHLDVPQAIRNSLKSGFKSFSMLDVIVVEFLCKQGSLTHGNELVSAKLH